MKKQNLLIGILMTTLMFSLCSCGNQNTVASTPTVESTVEESTSTVETVESVETKEKPEYLYTVTLSRDGREVILNVAENDMVIEANEKQFEHTLLDVAFALIAEDYEDSLQIEVTSDAENFDTEAIKKHLLSLLDAKEVILENPVEEETKESVGNSKENTSTTSSKENTATTSSKENNTSTSKESTATSTSKENNNTSSSKENTANTGNTSSNENTSSSQETTSSQEATPIAPEPSQPAPSEPATPACTHEHWTDDGHYLGYQGNCTDKYSVHKVCASCGAVIEEGEYTITQHRVCGNNDAVAPTCTTDGHNESSDCECGAIHNDGAFLPAYGHYYVDKYDADINTLTIRHWQECANCGDIQNEWIEQN